MPKDKRNNCEPKGVYRVRNWSEYNAGLIARGSVTMWINESALTMVSQAEPVMRGRPHVYSDALIQALLTLKQVYHLTLRCRQLLEPPGADLQRGRRAGSFGLSCVLTV